MSFLKTTAFILLLIVQTACASNSANNSTAQSKPASSAGGFVEQNFTFDVKGMHCGGCAKSIEAELKKIEGVSEATADFKSGKVTVVVDSPSQVERQTLVKAIEKASDGKTFKVTK